MLPLERIFYQHEISQVGAGQVANRADGMRFSLIPKDGYSNAQITDYNYKSWNFRWQPTHEQPVRLRVTAQASAGGDELRGTAGFGFWNHPFSPDASRLPRLPRAAWFFFGSAPNNMRLALDVAGHGWKAATLDAAHWRALSLAPITPLLMLLMRHDGMYRRVWRGIQPLLRVKEAVLDPALLAQRHTYALDWHTDHVRFAVDDTVILEAPYRVNGKLGFIAWIDNQYMVATPQGQFKWGIVPFEREQWLHIFDMQITQG